MIVMPSNNTAWLVHYWAGKYGGLGQLFSPDRVCQPQPHLPYGLDNGAWSAFKNGAAWDAEIFERHVARYAFHALRPRWLVCPDIVGDAAATIEAWELFAGVLSTRWLLPLAFAVQDGMTPAMLEGLRPIPDLLFVGGTTDWKWRTVRDWCNAHPRVHVGRVNGIRGLETCYEAGAESCDGTGWFRGDPAQIVHLGNFLRQQSGQTDDGDVAFVVKHSRIKHAAQSVMPFGGI